MITEDYVSFETAKLLKEKGFPQDTFRCHYLIDSNSYYKIFENKCGFGNYNIIAPTLQMAMKWLREVYDIDMWVEGYNRRYKGYIHSKQRGDEALFYEDSYEEACEVAIKYCLENLI